MPPKSIAAALDEAIQNSLEVHGAEILEDIYVIRERFEFISRDEFAEFVKRNAKEFTHKLVDNVKDNLL